MSEIYLVSVRVPGSHKADDLSQLFPGVPLFPIRLDLHH